MRTNWLLYKDHIRFVQTKVQYGNRIKHQAKWGNAYMMTDRAAVINLRCSPVRRLRCERELRLHVRHWPSPRTVQKIASDHASGVTKFQDFLLRPD
jgi:hypothetical protein